MWSIFAFSFGGRSIRSVLDIYCFAYFFSSATAPDKISATRTRAKAPSTDLFFLTFFQCLYPRPASTPISRRDVRIDQIFSLVDNVSKIFGDLLNFTCPLEGRMGWTYCAWLVAAPFGRLLWKYAGLLGRL